MRSDSSRRVCAKSLRQALEAVTQVRPTARRVLGEVWRRLRLLLNAVGPRQWTDATPVPPEFFGTMWPGGAAAGWPAAAPVSQPTRWVWVAGLGGYDYPPTFLKPASGWGRH